MPVIDFYYYFLFFPAITVLSITTPKSTRLSESIRLTNQLMTSYPGSGLVVPMPNGTCPVLVTVRLVINSFDGIDDSKEIVSVLGYVSLRWSDDFITDIGPALIDEDHSSPTSDPYLRQLVSGASLWTPSIFQPKDPKSPRSFDEARKSNSIEVRWPINDNKAKSIIRWDVDGRFQGRCVADVYRFPFDIQRCELSFLAMESQYKVILAAPPSEGLPGWDIFFDGERSRQNDMWQLDEIDWSNETYKGNISGVSFWLQSSRHPHFYLSTIILPCVLIAILQLVGLFHPHTPERPNYFVTVLLAFWVMIQVISNAIPNDPRGNCALVLCISMLSCLNVLYIIQSILVLRYLKMNPVKKARQYPSNHHLAVAEQQDENDYILKAKAKRSKQIFMVDLTLFLFGLCCTIFAPVYFYNSE